MTTLKKTNGISYTVGQPGVAATPGRPAVPGFTYSYTVATPHYGTVDTSSLGTGPTVVDLTQVGSYNPTHNLSVTYTYVTHTITVAGVPAVAPTAARASTTRTITDFQLGWNSSAVSIPSLVGDGTFSFKAGASDVGVVVGLSQLVRGPGNDYAQVQFGLYLATGRVKVLEYGSTVSAEVDYTDTDVLTIQRRGRTIEYFVNDTLLYTSTQQSFNTLYGTADLYSGGDTIVDAAIASTGVDAMGRPGSTPVTFRGNSTSAAVLQPVSSISTDRTSYAAVAAVLRPVTGSSTGMGYSGARVVLRPVAAFSADHAVGLSRAVLQPVVSYAYNERLSPAYAIVEGASAFVVGAAHGFTGSNAVSSTVLRNVTSLSADHAYGEVRAVSAPVRALSFAFPKINGYAFLKLTGRYRVRASGTEQPRNAFYGTLSFSLSARGGDNAHLVMPAARVAATGTVANVARAHLKLGQFTLAATGTDGSVGGAHVTLRSRYKLNAYAGSVVSITLHDGYTLHATGTTGSLAGAHLRMPLFELVASGTNETFGSAHLTMPALRAVPVGRAHLQAPRFRLVAIGSAMIAYTSEAYAMQMIVPAPQPGVPTPVQQISRYTQYPFTQILRHEGRYYGMAADGLYLLEGDTDDGAAIPWAMRTALDDFKSKQLKRMDSLYVDGRIDTQFDVNVIVGEKENDVYTYTTVRGKDIQNYRVQLGKGLRSRYYGIGIKDDAGHKCEIDGLDLEVDILLRAI